MTYKITNALRIISIIVLVFVFFISYAGLPEQVLIIIDAKGDPTQYVARDIFFYSSLTFIILSNILIYVLSIILLKTTKQRMILIANYLMALATLINVFISVELSFLGVLNGRENFNYSYFSPFFFLSGGLFVIWVFSFIISLLRTKK